MKSLGSLEDPQRAIVAKSIYKNQNLNAELGGKKYLKCSQDRGLMFFTYKPPWKRPNSASVPEKSWSAYEALSWRDEVWKYRIAKRNCSRNPRCMFSKLQKNINCLEIILYRLHNECTNETRRRAGKNTDGVLKSFCMSEKSIAENVW